MHGLKRNDKIPANESTKMILIEDDREDYERNKTREYHSQMKNMVSAMINCEGFKYNHSEVWNMKISAFMDSVKRISKIKKCFFIIAEWVFRLWNRPQKVSDKQLDWLGELE